MKILSYYHYVHVTRASTDFPEFVLTIFILPVDTSELSNFIYVYHDCTKWCKNIKIKKSNNMFWYRWERLNSIYILSSMIQLTFDPVALVMILLINGLNKINYLSEESSSNHH